MFQRRQTPPSAESPAVPSVMDPLTKPLSQEWEYEVLGDLGKEKDLKDRLNKLGQKGWILVSTTPAFIFRRPKLPQEEKLRAPVGFGSTRDQ